MSIKVETLTVGERLLIDRRRRKESQRQAGARLGISRTRYTLHERDIPVEGAELKDVVIIPSLQLHEDCLLQRRRSKVTQAEAAARLGCCVHQLRLMELGRRDALPLATMWKGNDVCEAE